MQENLCGKHQPSLKTNSPEKSGAGKESAVCGESVNLRSRESQNYSAKDHGGCKKSDEAVVTGGRYEQEDVDQ
jgi:hypothetical protein